MDAKEGEKEFIRRLQQQSLESIRHHQDSIQAKIKLLADKEMELQGARNSHRHTMNMLMVEESRTERLKQQLAEAREANKEMALEYERLEIQKEEIASKLSKKNIECANLKQANRWIPVSERLPEDCESVLILWGDEYGFMDVGHNREGFWWSNGEIVHSVTHWKPITKPE